MDNTREEVVLAKARKVKLSYEGYKDFTKDLKQAKDLLANEELRESMSLSDDSVNEAICSLEGTLDKLLDSIEEAVR